MGYIMELKTVQTNTIKTLIEALKEILTDANIELDENGLKIVAMDPSQTVLVHLKLNADKFEYFHCPKRLIIGVSMLNLFKLIKTMTHNDTLTLFIEESDINRLGIRINNDDKNLATTYKLNLMDLNEENYNIPPAEFESIITIPSSEFQKICRDMSNLTEVIEIKNIGQQLIFSCEGDFADQQTVIGVTKDGMSFIKENEASNIIQGYYNLKHLILFTKCTNLCNNIEIYMKNNFPIVISYETGSLGRLLLACSPRCD